MKIWVLVIVMVLAIVGVCLWYFHCGGVSHREIKTAVTEESAAIRRQVDERCDRLEAKLDRIESKLDRLESKLDRLIDLATPKLPDGMRPAEGARTADGM